LIWARTKRFIPETFNDWEVVGLNERWRFCRYVAGQHFGAHSDACFTRSMDERSFLTFMLYLNGGFGGGSTNFLEGVPDNMLKVHPKPGLLLVFQHNIYHEGEQLKSDKKYIMRSDVVYRKVRGKKKERKKGRQNDDAGGEKEKELDV